MRTLLIAALASTFVAPAPARADGLQAGAWELTTRVEVNGAAAPPTQRMRCLKPEEVADLDRTFSPVAQTVNSPCEQVEHEMTPTRLKWRLVCKGQVDMDVAGDFVFDRPDRYSATVVSTLSMLGRVAQETHTTIEARRLGDCR